MIKEGQLLVTFYSDVDEQTKSTIHAQLGGKKVDEVPQLHIEIIEIPVEEEAKYKKLYEQHSGVRFVDYNAIWKFYGRPCKCRGCNKHKLCECRPNDSYYMEKIETSQGLQNQWGCNGLIQSKHFVK